MRRYLLLVLLILPLIFVGILSVFDEFPSTAVYMTFGLILIGISILFLILSMISSRAKDHGFNYPTDKKGDKVRCSNCEKEISLARLIFSLKKEVRCKGCNTRLKVVLPGKFQKIEKIIIIVAFLISMIFALIGAYFIEPWLVFAFVLLPGLLAILFLGIIYNHRAFVSEE